MEGAVRVAVGVRGLRLVDQVGRGMEVMHRDDTDHGGTQCGGDPRIAHIGEVGHAVDRQIVNVGVEGSAHLLGRTAEIDGQPARLNSVDGESVRLEPCGDGGDVFLRDAVVLGELIGGEPLVEVRRAGGLKLLDVLPERSFTLGRALQLEKQVVEREVRGDGTTIVGGRCFGTGVVLEFHELGLIDRLADHADSIA